MELARIMATRQPTATMVFMAVAGEEQNLYGSNYQAQKYKNASVDIQGMFTNDIVGTPVGPDGTSYPNLIRLFAEGAPTSESPAMAKLRASIGGDSDSPARELARFVVGVAVNQYTEMDVAVIYRQDRYLRGGDHASFLKAGYPAARFTEPTENFAHQHQDVRVENGTQYGDLAQYLDYNYIGRAAKVNAASMWSLAQAPGTPRNVTIDTSVLTNKSSFKWEHSNEMGLAGYELLWRPTDAPFWTHVIPMGNVNSYTVDLSKDDVNFGIRAVGTNGYRSPAAFPFPG